MPFDVNVNTLDTALELVQGAAEPNGALAIDTWHMGKLGISPADLKRIPPEYLGWVELSDGQYENMPDPIDEVVNRRKLPGEGEFDIPGYVEACQEVGYDGPVGSRGPLRGASEPAHRRRVQARIRDDGRAVPRRRDLRRPEEEPTDGSTGQRQARLDVHADAADPRVRGARQADVRGASRRDPGPHPPRRRRRGVDRRVAGDDEARRPDDGDVSLPRLPDRARHRHQGDHGRDLRPQGRAVRRLRRLDAPDRPRARLPRHDRHRRAGHPAGHRASRSPRSSASKARSSCRSSATAPPSRARSTSR